MTFSLDKMEGEGKCHQPAAPSRLNPNAVSNPALPAYLVNQAHDCVCLQTVNFPIRIPVVQDKTLSEAEHPAVWPLAKMMDREPEPAKRRAGIRQSRRAAAFWGAAWKHRCVRVSRPLI
ncbi:hypothetical protein [Neisseria musculi]|uniref:hypothetical protein n=1 Tax=Neisseria musculi TaxID=1815583 RepID=UPI00164ADE23|nr:hypothetical protein [Neisseria musculi]